MGGPDGWGHFLSASPTLVLWAVDGGGNIFLADFKASETQLLMVNKKETKRQNVYQAVRGRTVPPPLPGPQAPGSLGS